MRKCTFYTSACSDRTGERKMYRKPHKNTHSTVTPTGDFPSYVDLFKLHAMFSFKRAIKPKMKILNSIIYSHKKLFIFYNKLVALIHAITMNRE